MGRRKKRGERGQALVEFALALPVLLLLLLGIIEFGLLLYNKQVITNAAREGARYGIVSRNPRRSVSEIETVVNGYCSDHLVTFGEDDTPVITVAPDPSTPPTPVFGNDLSVDVAFHYDFLVLPNFLGDLFGGIDLVAHSTMKYE